MPAYNPKQYSEKRGRWPAIILIILALWAISSFASSLLDGFGEDKIVVIPISGMLTVSGADFAIDSTFSSPIVQAIEKAREKSNVAGVILEIDTEGGTVFASKEIADAVRKLKAEKPVVALIREVGASGGYWIASASDYIIADPVSITGSLGVRGSFIQFSGLLGKYGISYEKIIAGEYKEMGNPFLNLSKEERAKIQEEVDKIYDYFITDIAKNRGMEKAELMKLATGEVFLGLEAKENGLVDALGDMDLALNVTKQMANITDARIERMEQESRIAQLFSKFASSAFFHMGRGIGSVLVAETAAEMPKIYA